MHDLKIHTHAQSQTLVITSDILKYIKYIYTIIKYLHKFLLYRS